RRRRLCHHHASTNRILRGIGERIRATCSDCKHTSRQSIMYHNDHRLIRVGENNLHTVGKQGAKAFGKRTSKLAAHRRLVLRDNIVLGCIESERSCDPKSHQLLTKRQSRFRIPNQGRWPSPVSACWSTGVRESGTRIEG